MSVPRNYATGLLVTLLDTVSVEPIDGVINVPIWVDWNRPPVSVHGPEQATLEQLILHLRNTYNVRRRSLVMPDRERGGYLFFIYQACNPLWIAQFLSQLEEE